jgi:hypothetical protein
MNTEVLWIVREKQHEIICNLKLSEGIKAMSTLMKNNMVLIKSNAPPEPSG